MEQEPPGPEHTLKTDDAGIGLCSSTSHMGFGQIKNDPRNCVQPGPAWTVGVCPPLSWSQNGFAASEGCPDGWHSFTLGE